MTLSQTSIPPIIGFVGWSGAGKTTLLSGVVSALTVAGLRVGVLKHAHHGFDMDRPGKDSYRAREAGASRVLVASSLRWALMGEVEDEGDEPPFAALIARMAHEPLDLIIVEGFSTERYPKIEVCRAATGQAPKCWPHDPHVIAVATDTDLAVIPPVRRLDLDDPGVVAEFIIETLALGPVASGVAHVG